MTRESRDCRESASNLHRTAKGELEATRGAVRAGAWDAGRTRAKMSSGTLSTVADCGPYFLSAFLSVSQCLGGS